MNRFTLILILLLPFFQTIQQRGTFGEMHRTHKFCNTKQRVLHTNVRRMDDVTVAVKIVPASSLLENRGSIFSLAFSDGFDVDVVRWL